MSSKIPLPTGNGLRSAGRWIAVAIIVATFITTGTLQEIKSSSRTIYVKGFAERHIKADKGSLTCFFSARGESLPEAYKQLAANASRVLSLLKNSGSADDNIVEKPVSIERKYVKDEKGYDTTEIRQYILHSGFTINTRDVDKISGMAASASALIEQDIDLSISAIRFTVSDLDEIKKQMLGEAMVNAKERATILTKNAGLSLGHLHSASQGIFQITAPNSTDVSDYGEYDTTTIEKVIKAVVSATFAVK